MGKDRQDAEDVKWPFTYYYIILPIIQIILLLATILKSTPCIHPKRIKFTLLQRIRTKIMYHTIPT